MHCGTAARAVRRWCRTALVCGLHLLAPRKKRRPAAWAPSGRALPACVRRGAAMERPEGDAAIALVSRLRLCPPGIAQPIASIADTWSFEAGGVRRPAGSVSDERGGCAAAKLGWRDEGRAISLSSHWAACAGEERAAGRSGGRTAAAQGQLSVSDFDQSDPAIRVRRRRRGGCRSGTVAANEPTGEVWHTKCARAPPPPRFFIKSIIRWELTRRFSQEYHCKRFSFLATHCPSFCSGLLADRGGSLIPARFHRSDPTIQPCSILPHE